MKKSLLSKDPARSRKSFARRTTGDARSSCDAVCLLGKPYHWIQSFVTEDQDLLHTYCRKRRTYREHARLGGFPSNFAEVKAVIDPMTSTCCKSEEQWHDFSINHTCPEVHPLLLILLTFLPPPGPCPGRQSSCSKPIVAQCHNPVKVVTGPALNPANHRPHHSRNKECLAITL